MNYTRQGSVCSKFTHQPSHQRFLSVFNCIQARLKLMCITCPLFCQYFLPIFFYEFNTNKDCRYYAIDIIQTPQCTTVRSCNRHHYIVTNTFNAVETMRKSIVINYLVQPFCWMEWLTRNIYCLTSLEADFRENG